MFRQKCTVLAGAFLLGGIVASNAQPDPATAPESSPAAEAATEAAESTPTPGPTAASTSTPTQTPTPTPTEASPEPSMAPETTEEGESAATEESAATGAPVPNGETLSPEALESVVRIDTVTVPTPGELMAAITKTGQPDWQASYREPIPTNYTSRPQLALNLGGLIADGYLAVEAADSQRVKNAGKDIIALAKALAVSQDVLARANSIGDFAEQNEWGTLKEELEATQNEVKIAMEAQGDQDLVILVSLGGWIRGTEIVTEWIAANHSPESARLLRQPAIVEYMRSQIASLPQKVQEDALVKTVSKRLEEIQEMVSFPAGTVPTPEQVKRLKDKASELVEEISKK